MENDKTFFCECDAHMESLNFEISHHPRWDYYFHWIPQHLRIVINIYQNL